MNNEVKKYQVNSQVVSTELEPTEAVLLHLDNQRYYTLNETGWSIWKHLKNGLALQQITNELQKEFDVDHSKAEESVREIVSELESERLIETQ
ncbi:PqqD family protein [candidate division KSB1 bacterium]|nr:PqqD family protein [candidate division KSB1 bacterium]